MKNNGFTLIEILLSIVLIAIVITALFPMFNQSFKSIFLSREKTEKINSVQKDINQFINIENPEEEDEAILTLLTFTDKGNEENEFTLEVVKKTASETIDNSDRSVELNYYILYTSP